MQDNFVIFQEGIALAKCGIKNQTILLLDFEKEILESIGISIKGFLYIRVFL